MIIKYLIVQMPLYFIQQEVLLFSFVEFQFSTKIAKKKSYI